MRRDPRIHFAGDLPGEQYDTHEGQRRLAKLVPSPYQVAAVVGEQLICPDPLVRSAGTLAYRVWTANGGTDDGYLSVRDIIVDIDPAAGNGTVTFDTTSFPVVFVSGSRMANYLNCLTDEGHVGPGGVPLIGWLVAHPRRLQLMRAAYTLGVRPHWHGRRVPGDELARLFVRLDALDESAIEAFLRFTRLQGGPMSWLAAVESAAV